MADSTDNARMIAHCLTDADCWSRPTGSPRSTTFWPRSRTRARCSPRPRGTGSTSPRKYVPTACCPTATPMWSWWRTSTCCLWRWWCAPTSPGPPTTNPSPSRSSPRRRSRPRAVTTCRPPRPRSSAPNSSPPSNGTRWRGRAWPCAPAAGRSQRRRAWSWPL